MRDEKGNLQLLPDEDELQKPKKPLTPYMLFVRDVLPIFNLFFVRRDLKWWQHTLISLHWML
jgi:hypothetical protein